MADLKTVRLSQDWYYDESVQLGRAGWSGEVFAGHSSDGRKVAVKRFRKELVVPAERELQFAAYFKGQQHPHVIATLDAGRDSAGQMFLVMERADRSLQDLIDEAAPLPVADALEILDAVCAGLEEIGDVVHRDLKPANILSHNGVWKLADLGNSRFVADVTSPHTLASVYTAEYSAPEQIRGERASKATDVYAFGGVLYAILTGTPPFRGERESDYPQQHLTKPPPTLPASIPPGLRQLGGECLAKSPRARPALSSIRKRIHRLRLDIGVAAENPQVVNSPLARASAALAAAAAVKAREKAEEEALLAQARQIQEDRSEAAKEAVSRLEQIMATLFEQITEEAPGSEVTEEGKQVQLGQARLTWKLLVPFLETSPKIPGTTWDIIAAAYLEVSLGWIGPSPRGRSANLWFGKVDSRDSYRWWEVAWLPNKFQAEWLKQDGNLPLDFAPYGLENKTAPTWDVVACDPLPIDGESEPEFLSRWKIWFADAAVYDPFKYNNPFIPIPSPQPLSARFTEEADSQI